jgi:hypothetical protein
VGEWRTQEVTMLEILCTRVHKWSETWGSYSRSKGGKNDRKGEFSYETLEEL